jgi:hypothetical protein
MAARPRRRHGGPVALLAALALLGACSDDDGYGDPAEAPDGPITGAEVAERIDTTDLTVSLESVSEPYDADGQRVINLEVRVESRADAEVGLPRFVLECGGVATPVGDASTYDGGDTLGRGLVASGFVVATLPDPCDLPEVVAGTDPEVHWPLDLD